MATNDRAISGRRRGFHLSKRSKVKKIMLNKLGRFGRFLGRALGTAVRGGKKGNPKVVSDPNSVPDLPQDP